MADTYVGECKICHEETDLIYGKCENCLDTKPGLLSERKIHEWDVSDEYGWRNIELWEVETVLVLRAFDQDGGEVEVNL
jgi:hypothetical protein